MRPSLRPKATWSTSCTSKTGRSGDRSSQANLLLLPAAAAAPAPPRGAGERTRACYSSWYSAASFWAHGCPTVAIRVAHDSAPMSCLKPASVARTASHSGLRSRAPAKRRARALVSVLSRASPRVRAHTERMAQRYEWHHAPLKLALRSPAGARHAERFHAAHEGLGRVLHGGAQPRESLSLLDVVTQRAQHAAPLHAEAAGMWRDMLGCHQRTAPERDATVLTEVAIGVLVVVHSQQQRGSGSGHLGRGR